MSCRVDWYVWSAPNAAMFLPMQPCSDIENTYRQHLLTSSCQYCKLDTMFVSFDCPVHYLIWLEQRRKRLGLRSRSQAIKEAIRIWAMVPEEEEKPDALARLNTEAKDWPEERIEEACCTACKFGEHCNGAEVRIPNPVKKVMGVFVCLCNCQKILAEEAEKREKQEKNAARYRLWEDGLAPKPEDLPGDEK